MPLIVSIAFKYGLYIVFLRGMLLYCKSISTERQCFRWRGITCYSSSTISLEKNSHLPHVLFCKENRNNMRTSWEQCCSNNCGGTTFEYGPKGP